MVLAVTTWAKNFDLQCSLPSKDGLERFDHCAAINRNGDVEIDLKLRAKIQFNEDGLAGLSVGHDCYWTNRKGLTKKTFCFDNGSDYFVDGFARFVGHNGKFGFMDKNLKVIISPKYDFVFPFENHEAKFCNGCKTVPEKDGQHSFVRGGVWGVVDRHEHIVTSKGAR